MKTYNVHLTELFYGSYEVEAKNKAEAIKIAKRDIKSNNVPSGIMDESEGYKLDAVEAQ